MANNICVAVGDFFFRKFLGGNNLAFGISQSAAVKAEDCAFTSDGSLLAMAGGGSPRVVVIETATMTEVQGIPQTSGSAFKCAFSPNGQFLAVGHSGDPKLTVYNTADWTVIAGGPAAPICNTVRGIAFSPDGSLLACLPDGAQKLAVYDTTTWTEVSGVPNLANFGFNLMFSPDGSLLAAAHAGSPNFTVIDTATWTKVTGVPAVPSTGQGCAFSPSGNHVAVAHAGGSRLTVMNTVDWSVVTGTPTLPNTSYACSFSPDGSLLAVAHQSAPFLTVIDTTTWTSLGGNISAPAWAEGCVFAPVDFGLYRKALFEQSAKIIDPDTSATIYEVAGGAEATLFFLSEKKYWAIMPDSRTGGTDKFAQIKPDAQSETLPLLELYLDYGGGMVAISSNLTTQAGGPGDEVVIRNWTTRELVAKVIPDANGDWSAEVPPGTYDVSYIAENCAPVIHGPYTVTLP